MVWFVLMIAAGLVIIILGCCWWEGLGEIIDIRGQLDRAKAERDAAQEQLKSADKQVGALKHNAECAANALVGWRKRAETAEMALENERKHHAAEVAALKQANARQSKLLGDGREFMAEWLKSLEVQ